MCYTTRMSTTHNNEETPRTCATCGAEIHPDSPGCYDCAEAYGVGRATDDEWAPEDPGIDGDHPTGYEADDERPYGWDVPEEEYPDW